MLKGIVSTHCRTVELIAFICCLRIEEALLPQDRMRFHWAMAEQWVLRCGNKETEKWKKS